MHPLLRRAIAKGRRRVVAMTGHTPPLRVENRDQRWKAAKKTLQRAGLKLKIRGYGATGPILQGIKHRKLGHIDLPWFRGGAGLHHIIDDHRKDAPDLSRLGRMRVRSLDAGRAELRNDRDTAAVAMRDKPKRWLITAFRRTRRD